MLPPCSRIRQTNFLRNSVSKESPGTFYVRGDAPLSNVISLKKYQIEKTLPGVRMCDAFDIYYVVKDFNDKFLNINKSKNSKNHGEKSESSVCLTYEQRFLIQTEFDMIKKLLPRLTEPNDLDILLQLDARVDKLLELLSESQL